MKIKLKDEIKKILSPKSETIIVGKKNVYDIFEINITGKKKKWIIIEEPYKQFIVNKKIIKDFLL